MLSKRSPSTPQQDTSITRLLSSPSSLIYLCMKTDNYEQAKHIIKLFNVNDDKSSKAVLFAEEYEKAFQKLALLEKNKSKEKTATPANKGRLSALKNIASAAAAGIASISPTSVVEELLLSSSIDLKSSGLIVTEPAHAHFVTALVCVDFLCTGHMSRRSCQNLLEMARMKINLGMGNYETSLQKLSPLSYLSLIYLQIPIWVHCYHYIPIVCLLITIIVSVIIKIINMVIKILINVLFTVINIISNI